MGGTSGPELSEMVKTNSQGGVILLEKEKETVPSTI
jgi:hypothetical protein